MSEKKKKISVTATCFNEKENLQEFYDRLIAVFEKLPQYDREMIFADNCSTDGTRDLLRQIAAKDKKFKVILNSRNFGLPRSPHNAFIQGSGDAVIPMSSDLQDPPELIPEMVREWEKGAAAVCAIAAKTKENALLTAGRNLFYWLLGKFSETKPLCNFTGFGLYDKKFMDALRRYRDPNPFFRGLVSEIGFRRVELPYTKDNRKHGKSKSDFFALYDVIVSGFINHSKAPLRLATFCGFVLAGICLLVSFGYMVYKLLFWETFTLGMAPLVIGFFFLAAIQLVFIGVVGEYVGAILTHVKHYPLVIEEEKINFEEHG